MHFSKRSKIWKKFTNKLIFLSINHSLFSRIKTYSYKTVKPEPENKSNIIDDYDEEEI